MTFAEIAAEIERLYAERLAQLTNPTAEQRKALRRGVTKEVRLQHTNLK
jgi:hypothetical protein